MNIKLHKQQWQEILDSYQWIIDDAERNGLLKPNDTIIEATSGNTGIALAMIGAERGYNVKIVMPCDMSDERKVLLKMFGADLIEVDEGDFEKAINLKDEIAETLSLAHHLGHTQIGHAAEHPIKD